MVGERLCRPKPVGWGSCRTLPELTEEGRAKPRMCESFFSFSPLLFCLQLNSSQRLPSREPINSYFCFRQFVSSSVAYERKICNGSSHLSPFPTRVRRGNYRLKCHFQKTERDTINRENRRRPPNTAVVAQPKPGSAAASGLHVGSVLGFCL